MTEAGLIIGTAAYMAPEQAKGKPVDRRADVWAFGCVLYEMLSGKKAFEGETVSDVLAAVIMKDPDWMALPETTPPAIQRLVRRCLTKDPKQRLRDIGDARIAIEETLSGATTDAETASYAGKIPQATRTSHLRRALPWTLGATTIAFAGFAAWLALQPKTRQNIVRFPVPQPENAEFFDGGAVSISPDGRTLAFLALPGPGKPPVLWVRPLDSLTAVAIPETEHASLPFWSPDSQWIGFYSLVPSAGKLEKVAVSGGTPQVLCDLNGGGSGATWSRDGVILYSNQRSLYRVADTGGTPTLVLAPDPAHQAMAYSFPQFLPDDRHFLVQVNTPGTEVNIVGAGSLDSKTVQQLARINSQVQYAAPGDLFYLEQSMLMARRFDATALRFTGPPVPVAQNVGTPFPSYGYYSVSPAGVLVYMAGANSIQNTPGQLTWYNRSGEKLGTVGQPEIVSTPALSPDGTKLAVGEGETQKQDIWVYDLKRGTASRLTFDSARNANPVWSADGSQILFSSLLKDNNWDIYQKDANGLGSTQPVFQSSDQQKAIDDLSPDGRYAIYDTANSPSSIQLWGLPLFGDRKPFAFIQGKFGATSARFSPTAATWPTPQTKREARKSTSKPSRSTPASGKSRLPAGRSRCGAAMAKSCSISPRAKTPRTPN